MKKRKRKINPLLRFASLGVVVVTEAITAGQIAERRWMDEDVEREIGVSRTTQWRLRKNGKLNCVRVGARHFYWTSQLKEAGLL